MSLPKQLLESKLITDEQWKEYQELKEEVNDLRTILNMQHKREYYSKFLKDFQKEKGKNVYPDFDEIYKRYDKQKEEIKRLEVENRELSEGYNEEFKDNARLNNIIKIMEKYFELILDLGYDYDGLNEKESLKKLIDELCRYASLGRTYNTTEIIYVNGDKKYNILNEELKGDDKE